MLIQVLLLFDIILFVNFNLPNGYELILDYRRILNAIKEVKPSRLELNSCQTLIQYLHFIDQKLLLGILKPIQFVQDEHMLIDATAAKSLELIT